MGWYGVNSILVNKYDRYVSVTITCLNIMRKKCYGNKYMIGLFISNIIINIFIIIFEMKIIYIWV